MSIKMKLLNDQFRYFYRSKQNLITSDGDKTTDGCRISEVNWTMVLSASLLAGVLSLLTSVAGLPELEKETWQEVE